MKANLKATQGSLSTGNSALLVLFGHLESLREAAKSLDEKLRDEQHKYDEADKVDATHLHLLFLGSSYSQWTWFYPPARLILEILKPIIEAITHNLEGIRNALNTAVKEFEDAQNLVQTKSDEVKRFKELIASQTILVSKGEALGQQSGQLYKDVEQIQKVVGKQKNDTRKSWEEISLCCNRAATAKWSFTKADYATSILKIVDVCIDDHIAQPVLRKIVNELADHDDHDHSIHDIKTKEHPKGLLDDVQKKLEQTTAQDYTLAKSSRGAPMCDGSVETRLKLLRSMIGPLTKSRNEPGGLDMNDADRVNLLDLVSSVLMTPAVVVRY